MILNLLFSLLLSQNNSNNVLGNRGCGLGNNDIFFINSKDDFNQIKDCITVNGSFFINGDYNIQTLNPMKNIENINGYLVIYDSLNLSSLKGLQNLKNIYSYNPYLLEYGVTIKYNNGLCFSNLVNWSKITNKNVIVSNNKEFCPNCHEQCNGCFGPGRLLCQECINYISGNACLENCPNGTNQIGNRCHEVSPNDEVELNFNNTYDDYKVIIYWDEPTIPNGFILEYRLFRDEIEIFKTYYNNDGYYANDFLVNQYIDNIKLLDTNYSYKISYKNSNGTKLSNTYYNFIYNTNPYNIENLQINNITNTSILVSWNYPDSYLEPTFSYSLNFSNFKDKKVNKNFNNYSFILDNLYPFNIYNLQLRAKYEKIGNSSQFNFITDIGIPPVPEIPVIYDNILKWKLVDSYMGTILYYIVNMNNTIIYNGSYLPNGLNLDNYINYNNNFYFTIQAYTSYNLNSISLPLNIFFPQETKKIVNFINDRIKWEKWILIIIISCFLFIIIIILLINLCKKDIKPIHNRQNYNNPIYAHDTQINNRNNVYDLVEKNNNDTQSTNSIEYLQIIDNIIPDINDTQNTNSIEYLQIIDNIIPEINNIHIKKEVTYDKKTVKRKITLLNELKMKLPKTVPKNMINE